MNQEMSVSDLIKTVIHTDAWIDKLFGTCSYCDGGYHNDTSDPMYVFRGIEHHPDCIVLRCVQVLEHLGQNRREIVLKDIDHG
jgi:hypothetical protein